MNSVRICINHSNCKNLGDVVLSELNKKRIQQKFKLKNIVFVAVESNKGICNLRFLSKHGNNVNVADQLNQEYTYKINQICNMVLNTESKGKELNITNGYEMDDMFLDNVLEKIERNCIICDKKLYYETSKTWKPESTLLCYQLSGSQFGAQYVLILKENCLVG